MLRSNIALVAATAVVTSAATAGLPAVARAGYDALNSDKVDGKHAVGPGASQKARRGKLVATSPKTGRLPNNIIAQAPDAERLDGRDLRTIMPGSWTFNLRGVDGFLRDYKSVQHFTLSLPGPGQLLAIGTVHYNAVRLDNTRTHGAVWFNDTADPANDLMGAAEWFIPTPWDHDPGAVSKRIPMLRTFDVAKAGNFTVHVIAGGAGGMRYHGGRAQFLFIPK